MNNYVTLSACLDYSPMLNDASLGVLATELPSPNFRFIAMELGLSHDEYEDLNISHPNSIRALKLDALIVWRNKAREKFELDNSEVLLHQLCTALDNQHRKDIKHNLRRIMDSPRTLKRGDIKSLH